MVWWMWWMTVLSCCLPTDVFVSDVTSTADVCLVKIQVWGYNYPGNKVCP